jgi:vacuolar protein sorting-associated protein 13A/C
MASVALTPIVKWLLNKYVSQYVEELDTRQLMVNLFKGEVELNNLTLRPDALEQMHLPFIVRAGRVQNLKIVCPLAHLGSKPVRVEIDGIYLMAARKDELGMAYDAATVAEKMHGSLILSQKL